VRYVRIFCDPDGASHFEDLDLELLPAVYAPPAPALDVSAPWPAERALLFLMPVGWYGGWHPSPRRQLYFNLGGRLEVVVSDGQSRVFGPGDIALVEDVTGVGHTTRVIGSVPSTGVFIHLADDARS
jgi:hypothetical protein